MDFFCVCLQFSINDVNLLNIHRWLPTISTEIRVDEDRTDEMMEHIDRVFFSRVLVKSLSWRRTTLWTLVITCNINRVRGRWTINWWTGERYRYVFFISVLVETLLWCESTLWNWTFTCRINREKDNEKEMLVFFYHILFLPTTHVMKWKLGFKRPMWGGGGGGQLLFSARCNNVSLSTNLWWKFWQY